jgi:signal transduction histidine kinase
MKLWPQTLRGRLILTVLFTLVLTQLGFLATVAQALSHAQRSERLQQMARQISFIRPVLERQPSVPLDTVLVPTAFAPRATIADAAPTALALKPPNNSSLPLPPVRISVMVTTQLPPLDGDDDLLATMRETIPDIAQVRYTETNGSFITKMTPHRPYTLESWTPLDQNRFLKITADQLVELRAPLTALPLFDLVVRGGIGIALALLITTWLVKPLTRLTQAADGTMPTRGNVNMGTPIEIRKEPVEIARALDAFERMRGRIGAMVAERTTMLTALAHDLRTPLTRLMLRVEMSSDAALRDEATRDCTKMHDLITRTLDFLKSAEQGNNVESVNVEVAIRRAVSSLGGDASQYVHIAPAKPALVRANAWGVERLFANVIDNAIKYGKRADVTITRGETHAEITVADYGSGVPAETLSKLAAPFYRIDSARNLDNGGAGLGLSIAENLARAYQGEISFANAAAKNAGPSGLTVLVRLPLTA